jgi:SAM-dependent methyltransferase
MPDNNHYAIRGGVPGRQRLRILSRVLYASTAALFDRLEVGEGMTCLDVGCGGGDVTRELAGCVGPGGKVVGVDIDATKLDLARTEADAHDMLNVEFRALDIRTQNAGTEFDVVYARFLLTHLDDPASAVQAFFLHLRPGGLAVVEDIDFNGAFTFPESPAYRRYHELYCAVVRKRGGDPNIGPRLPLLLMDAGFVDVDLSIAQPAGMQGEVKLIHAITLENIADAVMEDGLASRQEIDAMVEELYAFAANPRTVTALPRIVQAWGRRPAGSTCSDAVH